ncbi:hypothetical protein [Pandoraea pulmonicola]|uniref:Uncharacterized protein n=1 Tax=Pandoraea pulmonicola TaxID=93221 RepID=A0AAJ4ZAD0_PANPU|nr:hypothetical protein [Pandoraea pulmonicola]AJC21560.1 hypothetical protein RO07_15615 [Pandoraea pulmonicola]SUA89636.1 Uncharacterised protein [Pandoraea pulmonicola]
MKTDLSLQSESASSIRPLLTAAQQEASRQQPGGSGTDIPPDFPGSEELPIPVDPSIQNEVAQQVIFTVGSSSDATQHNAEQAAARINVALNNAEIPHIPTNQPGAESHRFVNQIDYVEHQARKNGLDLAGTTELVLSAITKKRDAPINARAFAERQARILQSKGVDTPEKLCAMLREAKKLDLIAAGCHGLAGSAGFNGMSAFLNLTGRDVIADWIGMGDKPTLGEMAAMGGIAGVPLGVSDVVVDPALERTFHDAYYTRPPAESLPEWVNEARASKTLTTAQLGHLMGTLFVGTYGARNLLRFATSGLAAASGAPLALVGTIDDYFDPVGGCFAGMGFRVLRHILDEKRGESGVPYLLARTDLADCIDALNSSNAAKAASMGIRAAKHLGNSVTRLPEGLFKSVTTLEGIASQMILAAGFASVFVARTAAGEASHGNLVAEEGAKYAALMALYYGYGQGMAAAHMHDPNSKNVLGAKASEGIDSGMQYMADRLGMVLRRRSNAAHASHDEDPGQEDEV